MEVELESFLFQDELPDNDFNATVSGGKHIPAEVLDMMTPLETERALAHLGEVYAKVKAEAKQDLATMANRQMDWHVATTRFVTEENARLARRGEKPKRVYLGHVDLRSMTWQGALRRSGSGGCRNCFNG